MKKLLETLSDVHKKDRASGGTDFDMTLTHIMADAHKPKFDKTVKNVTIKTIKSPTNPIPPASVSDVNVSVRSGAAASDFTATMIDFQKKVADESFNVMQLVVRTMTGLFPKVSKQSQLHCTFFNVQIITRADILDLGQISEGKSLCFSLHRYCHNHPLNVPI